jgi:hypothetical protein
VVVLTQEGGIYLWKVILGAATPGPYVVHLFASDYQPQHTDTLATYAAIELVVSGYAPIQLVNPSTLWAITAVPYGAQAAYQQISWAFAGACTVYGYYVVESTNTWSVWAELFATPFVYGSSGGPFGLQLIPSQISCPFPEPLCPA